MPEYRSTSSMSSWKLSQSLEMLDGIEFQEMIPLELKVEAGRKEGIEESVIPSPMMLDVDWMIPSKP